MIQYALKCANGHRFDSWFQSADAYDKLRKAGMVTCAMCGTTEVRKELMAPSVRPARKGAPAKNEGAPADTSLRAPATQAEQMISEMKKQVEANSDYVGDQFASEARAMHLGDSPERAIHGEAKLDEAKALIEEGIPVLPLPFRPSGKDN